jgi:hypothetical protein
VWKKPSAAMIAFAIKFAEIDSPHGGLIDGQLVADETKCR